MRNIITIVLIALILTGCAQQMNEDATIRIDRIVYRYIDREAGVVCWIYENRGGGIDCMPISETLLDLDK